MNVTTTTATFKWTARGKQRNQRVKQASRMQWLHWSSQIFFPSCRTPSYQDPCLSDGLIAFTMRLQAGNSPGIGMTRLHSFIVITRHGARATIFQNPSTHLSRDSGHQMHQLPGVEPCLKSTIRPGHVVSTCYQRSSSLPSESQQELR
jgi:hypothetical protein